VAISLALAAYASSVSSLQTLLIPLEGVSAAELRDSFAETHNGHAHEAIDIPAARGTPVHSAVDGTIRKLFLSKQGGITIYQFDQDEVLCYYYAHLDGYAPGLREGLTVKRGDVIGFVGSTGNASPSAPHLHFTIFELGAGKQWWKGKALNPYPALLAAVGRR
jgi:murein DD-endopeptidase MepM/ murein hydrolase activator NlpD